MLNLGQLTEGKVPEDFEPSVMKLVAESGEPPPAKLPFAAFSDGGKKCWWSPQVTLTGVSFTRG